MPHPTRRDDSVTVIVLAAAQNKVFNQVDLFLLCCLAIMSIFWLAQIS